MAQADCCALCIDIVVLRRHQLAKGNKTLASWNTLGFCIVAHRVFSSCGPREEVAKGMASPSSPSKPHWFDRNLEPTLVLDDGVLLTGKGQAWILKEFTIN